MEFSTRRAGQFLQRTGEPAPGEIPQAVNPHPRLEAGLHLGPEGHAVGFDRWIQSQAMAGRQDRQPVAAQIATHQQLIAHLDGPGADRGGALDQADAAGGEEQPIRLAPLHHLGVARHDGHAAGLCRPGHGGHDPPQARQLQPLLQDPGHADLLGSGAGHGQVIGRAGDGQLADVASGKFQGVHHIAVGGEGQCTGGPLQGRRIVQQQGWIAIQPAEFPIDQFLHQGAAAPMAQADALLRHRR